MILHQFETTLTSVAYFIQQVSFHALQMKNYQIKYGRRLVLWYHNIATH